MTDRSEAKRAWLAQLRTPENSRDEADAPRSGVARTEGRPVHNTNPNATTTPTDFLTRLLGEPN